MPPNLLEGNPLAGNDQKAGELYEVLTRPQDIVTLQIGSSRSIWKGEKNEFKKHTVGKEGGGSQDYH